MDYLLFDDPSYFDLLPLTWTRPVYDLRIGIDRIHEKWARSLEQLPFRIAYDYLGGQFNLLPADEQFFGVNGKFIPDAKWAASLPSAIKPGQFLLNEEGEVVAAWLHKEKVEANKGLVDRDSCLAWGLQPVDTDTRDRTVIRKPADLFQQNGKVLREDFAWYKARREDHPIDDPHTKVYKRENILVEAGAKIQAATLNAGDGPIYIGQNASIQEGSIVHGAHALLAHSVVNMGAKLRGDSTVGPWSKVGGEVANSILQGFSNKGHDGYLGNSLLGYWCNLGADTNTSNLKNNYDEVKIWNYPARGFRKTGTIFCGLIMGDHSKCGINTMFNTGTVVGVSANIFGSGYPRNFIPSFSWGGAHGMTSYRFDKAMKTARIVMARRKIELEEVELDVLQKVYDLSDEFRPKPASK